MTDCTGPCPPPVCIYAPFAHSHVSPPTNHPPSSFLPVVESVGYCAATRHSIWEWFQFESTPTLFLSDYNPSPEGWIPGLRFLGHPVTTETSD